MKITRIHLQDFHQFREVDIDLTYPRGHKKEGLPLDKICIIGQSGTGKTTLLKIIGGHTYTLGSLFSEYSHKDFEKVRVFRKLNELEVKLGVTYKAEEAKNYYTWMDHSLKGEEIEFEKGVEYQKQQLDNIKTQFIYFPADLHYEFESSGSKLSDKAIIDFREDKVGDVWALVFEEIQKFQEEEIKLKQQIAKIAVDGSDIEEINKAVKKLERWKKRTENPINRLAHECLDPILKHLNLRVKREFNFESKEDIGLVKIEDLNGNEVPYHLLSTGTKQILLTALPLYLLHPDETLILCDEPERSLYPSIQRIIIDYYISLTKNSQFFFATHSPIIASCFDPWEIIELRFNDKGYVYQEKYYTEGTERHVDNYNIIPAYLTYDLMLSKVFDLQETHSHERSEKISEVLMLRNHLIRLRDRGEINTGDAKEIYKQYKSLASKLFWEFEIQ